MTVNYHERDNVNYFADINTFRDNGGRRSGIDRRIFSYAGHIPERRFGEDRRSAEDRRAGIDRRNGGDADNINLDERRTSPDRRKAWNSYN